MAVFNKNSLTQVSGFDNPIIAGELVFDQRTFWNLEMNNGVAAVDLTGATIDAQIIRRNLSNVRDSRYGLTFDIYAFAGSTSSTGAHTHSINDPGHNHSYVGPQGGSGTNAGGPIYISYNERTGSSVTGITINSAGAHTHDVSGTIASSGSSGTNANLQPYLVVKMWKRTA